MKKKGKRSLPAKAELVAGILACLLMGTVFLFGNAHWMKEITWEESVYEKLIYTSHVVPLKRGRAITMYFSDHKPLSIHGSLRTHTLEEALEDIRPGTQVGIYSHPNSNYIMDLTANGQKLLTFERAQEVFGNEKTGFQIFGAFLYAGAVLLIVLLIDQWKL